MKIQNISTRNVVGNLKNYSSFGFQSGDNIKKEKQPVSAPFFNSSTITAINNISFHGISEITAQLPTMQDKLNSAIQNLDSNSMVVFCDDMDRAKELIKNQVNSINIPLINIYFVKNENDNTGFAIYKDKDEKLKIFKLHPLDMINTLRGGTEEYGPGVKREYLYMADDPVELQDGDFIKFGPIKKPVILETKFKTDNLRFIFDKYVKKYRYLDDIDDVPKFNSIRLNNMGTNAPEKVEKQKIMFDDIGAQDEIIETLEENVIFPVKYPDFYKGFRINKGILLYGPPRCGKTMLALALANEMHVNFIKISADDLTHANVGKTEENWRELFKSARENQPTIIFIDEFDAVAKQRSGSEQARYQDNVVNQLLALMSDLEKSDDTVFVIAATNRKDLLDKALINTGRFGLQLEVKEPDLKGTGQIYQKHSRNKPLADNIDSEKLCKMMFEKHFNGSDIAETFYVAHHNCLKRNGIFEKMRRGTVTNDDLKNFELQQQDMEEAIYKIAQQK